MSELALFPLQIVVFPGESVPLHIFEPRYRQLVKDTMETGDPFGHRVDAAHGDSRPRPRIENRRTRSACTVRMESNEVFPDGRYKIGCIGERRFRIIEKLGERPYWVANVEYLDDPADAESAEAYTTYDATAELYRDHLGLALALQKFLAAQLSVAATPESAGQPHCLKH